MDAPAKKQNPILGLFKTIGKSITFSYKYAPKQTVVIFVLIAVIAVLPIGMLWLESAFIDQLIQELTTKHELSVKILTLIGLMILVNFMQSLVREISYLFKIKWRTAVEFASSENLLYSIGQMDMVNQQDTQINNLITKVEYRDMEILDFLDSFMSWFEEIVMAVSSFVVILLFSPLILLVTVITLIPRTMVNVWATKKGWNIHNKYLEEHRYASWTQHYIKEDESAKELKIFSLVSYLVNKYKQIRIRIRAEHDNVETKASKMGILTSLINGVGGGLAMILVITEILNGRITIGKFTFYRGNIGRFSGNLSSILSRGTALYERSLYVSDIFKLFSIKPSLINGNKIFELVDNKAPTIRLENVWFKYPNSQRYVLKGLDLEIEAGKNLAIVGENGAGKTTIINLILRYYDPTRGRILINGIDIKELDINTWYRYVSALFQRFNFYHFTAGENIAIGDVSYMNDLKRIKTAAKYSGADDFISKYELGYDTPMSKKFTNGVDPSEGQKQKIALARAFFKNPPVIILDEPTSAIDPKAEYEIFERLFDFAQDKTVIIISHRFSTVRNADRIIVLDNGEVIEDGTHEKLIKKRNGKYKHAFELQKKGYQ